MAGNSATDDTTTTLEQNSSSIFHQQLLDGLETLSVTDDKSGPTKLAGLPILTPANSICVGDDFALFTSSPPSANVISANGNKKTDDDLWSDFESFRNEGNNNNTVPLANTNSTAATFDDWAKF